MHQEIEISQNKIKEYKVILLHFGHLVESGDKW